MLSISSVINFICIYEIFIAQFFSSKLLKFCFINKQSWTMVQFSSTINTWILKYISNDLIYIHLCHKFTNKFRNSVKLYYKKSVFLCQVYFPSKWVQIFANYLTIVIIQERQNNSQKRIKIHYIFFKFIVTMNLCWIILIFVLCLKEIYNNRIFKTSYLVAQAINLNIH